MQQTHNLSPGALDLFAELTRRFGRRADSAAAPWTPT
jgi:hypothetical protein